jgi:hypothetical protein
MSFRAFQVPFTLLCRLYENAPCSVSNLCALVCTFGSVKNQQQGRTAMNVIPVELGVAPTNSAPKRHGFWRGLAHTLEALVAYPSKHAVSETELRRIADDIGRCRRLMFKKSQFHRDARLGRVPMHHATRAIKARP